MNMLELYRVKNTIVLVLCFVLLVPVYAVDYCASKSWGYAGTDVTGGGNVAPTLVSSESDLKNAIKSNNKVIIITQNITVSSQLVIDNKNHITLMALPGVKLINLNQTQNGSGILQIKNGSTNIILRNLTFEGPGAFDCDGRDNLTITNSQNIWVDHCDFQDAVDGNFDINGLSDNITVTWCRFRYLKAPRPRDAGDTDTDHTDDHRFSNLVGSSSSDKPSDGIYNITYGYCWWDQGCKQRMTRCRNALIHYLNCYWNSSVADYYVGPERVSSYFEGCTFAGKANTASAIWKPFSGTTNYCTFVNCTGKLPDNSSTPVAAPSYAYDHLTAAEAKNYVTKADCGAGATLTVTAEAEVSSSCDNGSVTPEDPTTVSGECCVDLSLGEAPSVANGGFLEKFDQLAIYTSLNHTSSKWDQGWLNLGSNADYITFDFSAYQSTIASVEFDVTIPNWAETKNTVSYHWNTESNTSYTIASNATEMVRLTAPTNAKSFTIQRSASTGTRISEVCFQIKSIPMDIQIPQNNGVAHKVLRHGHILIQREGRYYNLLGGRIL